jgi:hypothetical protein
MTIKFQVDIILVAIYRLADHRAQGIVRSAKNNTICSDSNQAKDSDWV